MMAENNDGKPVGAGSEEENSPFLNRWSRRKLEQEEAQAGTDAGAAPSQADSAGEADEQHRVELQKNREDAEAIDLESLDAESDYAPFFRDGVPKALKSAALRTLWRSSPVFANLDGLNDYDENFNDPDRIKKFVGTAWRVGKGYLKAEPDPADVEAAAEDLVQADPGDNPADGVDEGIASADEENSGSTVAKSDNDADQMDEKADPEDARTDVVSADDDSEDKLGMVEKVPLRSRLALDDWDTGEGA